MEEDKPKSVRIERLDWGEAWMWCRDCMAKLYAFDGYEDRTIPCPTKKKCKEENERYG